MRTLGRYKICDFFIYVHPKLFRWVGKVLPEEIIDWLKQNHQGMKLNVVVLLSSFMEFPLTVILSHNNVTSSTPQGSIVLLVMMYLIYYKWNNRHCAMSFC